MHKLILVAVIALGGQGIFGQSLNLTEIVRSAYENNGEIKIARFEVEKARARLTQAGLRPNPVLEVEQATGRFVGSSGERESTVGMSMPLELYGQRKRRIDLARAEITLKEAEVNARERDIAARVITDYIEALSAARELRVIGELIELDLETVRFVQIRVNEGESAPLELSLLQTEVERLRAQRHLAEGRLNAAVTKLKLHAGIAEETPLVLQEDLAAARLPALPPTLTTSIDEGLRNRPELRLANLEEQLAGAGLRLIHAQSRPDVAATARYSQGRVGIDDPRGPFFQSDRSLTFGISIGLPVFNRNQGAKAEAEIAIRQAQERRIYAERIVRNEVTVAFQQIESARRAVIAFETVILPRSRENLETLRRVYEIGEIGITDLLTEQRKLLDANRDLTDAYSRRYKAETDLITAIGIKLDQ
jgi:outer membrane protein, heavy metal efflux system